MVVDKSLRSTIEQLFREKIGQQIEVVLEDSFFFIATPFTMSDGDVYYIALDQDRAGSTQWRLTDHGHTLMHLSYDMDYDSLSKGSREKIISRALSQAGIQRENDELFIVTEQENLDNALVEMIQAISRISDVTYLSREQVKDTFLEDFRTFIGNTVSEERVQFDYVDPHLDPKRLYPVDAYLNGTEDKPLYVFAINSDGKCRDATITLYEHERWGIEFRSAAVFRDQTEINRNVLARFSDVVGQQFSSLVSNETRICQFIRRELNR